MRVVMIAAGAAFVALAAAAPAGAVTPAANPSLKAVPSDVTPAANNKHRRNYRQGYYHRGGGGWVPQRLRGYADPGYAYHGNINGCVVDLGYGRWESCSVGR